MKRIWFIVTSFEGRLTRRQYWIGLILALIATLIAGLVGALVDVIFGTRQITQLTAFVGQRPFFSAIYFVAGLFFSSAVVVKRLHDRNKGARWLYLQFIPLLGSIWLFVETGFLSGTKGPNDWGADPRAKQA